MEIRNNARALIINPEGQILLLKLVMPGVVDPSGKVNLPYWLTPGGGIEVEETPAEAAAREIYEECGIDGVEIGPMVWFCEHELEIRGRPVQSRDYYFLVRTADSSVSTDEMEQYEHQAYSEYRWWSPEEIKESTEVFAPPGLGQLLGELLEKNIEDMHSADIPW